MVSNGICNFKYLVVCVLRGFWIDFLGSFNDSLVFTTFNVEVDRLLLSYLLLGITFPKGGCSLKAIQSLLFLIELRLCFEELHLVIIP